MSLAEAPTKELVMSWFFMPRMSDRDKEAALALIRHLAKLDWYQQRATEIYNDAIAFAAGVAPLSEGMSFMLSLALGTPMKRASVCVTDIPAVKEHVLPALQAKEKILQAMETEHRNFDQPTARILKRVYDDYSRFLRVMQERTRLLSEVVTAWLEDQSHATETSHLDAAERQASIEVCVSRGELIRKVGLDTDAWLDLNCDACNAVRETVGLTPLSAKEFRSMYFDLLAGKRVRFFAQG